MATSSQVLQRNKLIIRRLPPNLPEDIFWQSVSPWITSQTCQWKRFVRGNDSGDARPVFSRAYVLMPSTDALVDFHRGFDGHIFKSKTGVEFQAVVEFAPYQKTPLRAKNKVDARQGTIDDDPDYKSFLESLSAPTVKPLLEPAVPAPPPTSTPLLDHLRETRANKAAKSKSKGKGVAEQPRDAAIAAVNKAAASRAPKDGNVTMVAGKGRGVVITQANEPAANGPSKSSKKSKKKGGEAKPDPPPPTKPSAGPGPSTSDGPTRGGRGGGGQRGARGGGRGGSQKDEGTNRTAHDAVAGILNKNAERGRGGGGGRGGSKGGGRGRGGAARGGATANSGGPASGSGAASPATTAASRARIDM